MNLRVEKVLFSLVCLASVSIPARADPPDIWADMRSGHLATWSYSEAGECQNMMSDGVPQDASNCEGEYIPATGKYGVSGQPVSLMVCPPGYKVDIATLVPGSNPRCQGVFDIFHLHHQPPACLKTPNPIEPMTGSKTKTVETGFFVGGQQLILLYDSINRPPSTLTQVVWNTNFHKSLGIIPNGTYVLNRMGAMQAVAGAGGGSNPCGTSTTDVQPIEGNSTTGFSYIDLSRGLLEGYNPAGQLQTVYDLNGNVQNTVLSDTNTPVAIAPGPGLLLKVMDSNGRSVSFTYDANGLIATITDTSSAQITLSHDANGMLTGVTWPDGKTRGYVYEDARFSWALTGIIDENGSRYQTYTYGPNGEAVSSELAGGVDKYVVNYPYGAPATTDKVTETNNGTIICRTHNVDIGGLGGAGGIAITTPSGAISTTTVDTSLGFGNLAGLSQPAGSGCAASNSHTTFDSNGFIASQDDFNGARTCFTHDTVGNELVRVEGLSNTIACSSVLPVGSTLPVGSSKTTTSWHPDFKLPVVITQAMSTTTNVYNGQPDPFNWNIAANCSPSVALPDGKPLPLLCKTVVQATGAATTTTSTTYDASGRVLTSIDVGGRTTSYAYYSDTSFSGTYPNSVGHTVGDLQSISAPGGFVTTFNLYDPDGHLMQMTDPVGIVTNYTYTLRGWVNTQSISTSGFAARTTSYSYDGAGQLMHVVQPDGKAQNFTYDAAHRLIGVTDAKGSSIAYTLDNSGNKVAEMLYDPQGVLQRQVTRSFDALNRLQQVTGAPQ